MDYDHFNNKRLDLIESVLFRRKQSVCASLLSFKEREIDDYLPDDVSSKLRTEILDKVNELYESCLDVVESSEGAYVIFNELFEERMNRV